MANGATSASQHNCDRRAGAPPGAAKSELAVQGPMLTMPYRVCMHAGPGGVGIVVETAREALAKAARFAEEGHEKVLKDLLGNVLTHAAVIALAEDERR